QGMLVIAGNGTLQAAHSLGWLHVAVVLVDDDAATAAGYSIADNRTAELAGWGKKALGKLLGGPNGGEGPPATGMSGQRGPGRGSARKAHPGGPDRSRPDSCAARPCPHAARRGHHPGPAPSLVRQ